ncbi:MAG TPA: hypothetical protein VF263_21660, partial [Longimicrobiaceae bacterium]
MDQQYGRFTLAAKRDFLDTVFNNNDVGEIFVTAFRRLIGDPDFVQVLLSDSRAKIQGTQGTGKVLLRVTDSYTVTRDEIVIWLNPLTTETDRIIDPDVLVEVKDVFWKRLRFAISPLDFVATVLGLLDAIESRLASQLIRAFREQRSPSSPIAIPVHPSQILPKPRLGFGTGIVVPNRFPPPIELPDEAIVLGEYFGRLAVTPSEAVFSPQPALHVHSWTGCYPSREEPEWRIAMLSILADLDDVDWQADGGFFRGTSLRNRRVHVRLAWALDECSKFQPDIIIIPELNIDAAGKDLIEEWLRDTPYGPDRAAPLVVYGGLHFPDPDTEGCYRNQPVLLTPARELRWDYWKRYGVRGKLKKDDLNVDENLGGWPQHVLAIDLPVGRVAVLICKDFLMEATRKAIQQLQPSVLVVPAMTSWGSVEDFRLHARTFASSLRCVTLFCNSSVYQRKPWRAPTLESPRTLGIVHINTRIRSDKLPSHVLDSDETRAVVGLYTLAATTQDLEFT